MLVIGRRYLFMTQRYAFAGTVLAQTPTHAQLGDDAIVIYEDIGPFEDWSSGKLKETSKCGKVPGYILCMLGTDAAPIPSP